MQLQSEIGIRSMVGFYSFLFGLALLAFGGCSPQNLAAAKGEQGIPVHRILTMFLFSESAAPLKFSGRKIAFSAFAAHLCEMCKTSLGESKTIFCPTTTSLPSNSCKQRKRLAGLARLLTLVPASGIDDF